MFSAGVATTQAFLKQAWVDAEGMRERSRQRMHSSDAESLQAQIDQLRLYVATLFQILIAHKAFTADEARALMERLDAADGTVGDGYQGRDVVTGAELPAEENPFSGIGGPGQ